MPRHITDTRPVTRKVTTTSGDTIVVTLTPDGLAMRYPRARTTYVMPYGIAFQQAVRLAVADQPRRRRRPRRGLLRRGA